MRRERAQRVRDALLDAVKEALTVSASNAEKRRRALAVIDAAPLLTPRDVIAYVNGYVDAKLETE